MITLLMAVAMAGKWDGLESDVVAEVTMDAGAPIIREQFEDLHTLDLYSDECISELQIGEPSAHLGAPFRVRYHAGPWSRLVEGTVSEVGHQYVDWDHTGRYGFATRYQFQTLPDGQGTRVTMTTFLDPPPWPFKGIFYKRVRPAWAECHHELLTAVADKLAGRYPVATATEAGVLPPPVEIIETDLTEPGDAEDAPPMRRGPSNGQPLPAPDDAGGMEEELSEGAEQPG